jgi:hypothetical protein
MKHSFLFLSVAVVAVAACNEPQQSTTKNGLSDTSKAVENKIMIPSSSCYSTTTGKDSVHLKVEVFPNVVTGNLSYQFYQKDSNKGEFEGRLHGDTLLADYTFMSEGKRSIRQVAFLIKDGIAVEGYGNMEEKNGKLIFKNQQEIVFGKGLKLEKVPCGE